jgi:hypothetical protein
MNSPDIIESLKASSLFMVRQTLEDMDKLNANNISLSIMALIAYNGQRSSKLVSYLCKQLLEKQLDNGSWLDELWPTGLALLALFRYVKQQGKPFDYRAPHIRKALEYIESTRCEQRSNWQGEIIETILLCWVLVEVEYQKMYGFVREALERLKTFCTRDGGLFDIYDTAVALCAFHKSESVLGMNNQNEIANGLRWLKRWDPSHEPVWNRAMTLFMISEIGLPDKSWTDSVISSILHGEERGVISDAHDEQALAILALSSVLNKWYSQEFDEKRIPVDELLTVASKDRGLQRSQRKLNRLIKAIVSAEAPEQLIVSGKVRSQRHVWDLFICHASEDKETIARPLAESLISRGLRVWYDEFTLKLGDSLSRKIDEGLANSRFGAVILSPSFFNKQWPRIELDGLRAKEASSGKTILPVWHNLDREYVLRYSPVLADRLAVSTSKGLNTVVSEIMKAVANHPKGAN